MFRFLIHRVRIGQPSQEFFDGSPGKNHHGSNGTRELTKNREGKPKQTKGSIHGMIPTDPSGASAPCNSNSLHLEPKIAWSRRGVPKYGLLVRGSRWCICHRTCWPPWNHLNYSNASWSSIILGGVSISNYFNYIPTVQVNVTYLLSFANNEGLHGLPLTNKNKKYHVLQPCESNVFKLLWRRCCKATKWQTIQF